MLSSRRLMLAVLSSAALIAGCGDDDGGGGSAAPAAGEERTIAQLVERWAESEDTPATCRNVLTPRFVEAVYGSLQDCVRKARDNDEDDPLSGVSVSDVQIDGQSASSRLRGTTEGFELDGEIRLARQDGSWRIDALGDDFLRLILSRGLATGVQESLTDDKVPGAARLVRDADLEGCLDDRLGELSDAELRTAAYSVLGERDDDAQETRLQRLLGGCLTGSDGGREILRRIAETGLRESLGPLASCVIAQLRQSSDDLLVDVAAAGLSGRQAREETVRLQQAVRAAAAGCQQQSTT